jgi:hypothetical protein
LLGSYRSEARERSFKRDPGDELETLQLQSTALR